MVLIILVNFSLLIISSYTYIVTRVSNMLLYFITFTPTIFAIAEPLKRFATCQKKILYIKLFSINKSVLIIINNKSTNETLYNYCIYIYIYIYMLYMCVIYIVIYYTNIVILYNYIIIYV